MFSQHTRTHVSHPPIKYSPYALPLSSAHTHTHAQSSLSDLLRHEAEAGLRSMVRTLFSRIPDITAADPLAASAGPGSEYYSASPPAPVPRTPWAGQQVAAAAAAAAAERERAAEEGAAGGAATADALAAAAEEEGSSGAPAGGEPSSAIEDAEPATPPPKPPTQPEATAGEEAAAATADGEAAVVTAEGGGTEGEDEEDADAAGPGAPYGVGCLYEVLRFLIGLIDPSEPHNPPPVRAFALAALHAAMQAGGQPLGQVAALSSLLSESLSYSLITNIECAYGASADDAPPAEVVSLVLRCCEQLFSVVGILASPQQEALILRVHLALLKSKTLHHDKRLIVLESVMSLVALPRLPLHMYAAYDCNLMRADVLTQMAECLATAAKPEKGQAVDSANLLALEALIDLLAASAEEDEEGEGGDGEAAASLLETRVRKTQIQSAAAKFNEKPKKGMEEFQALGLLSTPLEASQCAAFFRATPQLSKQALGDFLSGPEVGRHAHSPIAQAHPHTHHSTPSKHIHKHTPFQYHAHTKAHHTNKTADCLEHHLHPEGCP